MLTEVGLRGAVVIVTGAGSGIGAATARQLGTVGAPVVLVGRREAPLKEVAAQVTADGGDALCVPADLADPASPQRIADALDHAAAEPAGVVHDRRGHPAGRRPGH